MTITNALSVTGDLNGSNRLLFVNVMHRDPFHSKFTNLVNNIHGLITKTIIVYIKLLVNPLT